MKIDIGLADLIRISPMIAIFLASLIPLTSKLFNSNKEPSNLITLIQGLGGLIIGLVLLTVVGGSGETAFNKALIFDSLTLWMGIIAIVSAGAALIMMYENFSTNGNQFSELVFLALNSVVGMLILVSALDLLTVFIGLELMSLSLYLMIGMSHEEKLSKEAAFKYFVLGSFASAIFLYGTSFIYGTTGSTNLVTFMQEAVGLVQTNRLFLFGISFVILGFCFKVSIAPFHAWTPDVYQGAPTPHTAFMATAVKVVSFAALLRVIATKALVGSDGLFVVLQWLAVITMLVGNLGAIVQVNLKRMLAYSSIAHSGYILVGVITAGISDKGFFGASSVIFYLFSYCVMTIGTFAIVSILEKSEDHLVTLDSLKGLASKKPLHAFCFSLFLISLAGLPPALGFFGKFYLFNAAVGEGLIWLAVWGVINSVISVYYYLKPMVLMYMTEGEAEIAGHSLNATTVTVLASAVFIAILGVLSGPIFTAVEKSFIN
ncbi:MAG: NADH-quinone oxidoreductase subunit N [Bdellovibrionaceae bacterium]|nr:NADH-quinone oxidoreductase subunit N [Pseudobdellovibrionaceae bacterium]